MRLSKITLGATTVVAILAAITISARLGETQEDEREAVRFNSAAPLFCAGLRTQSTEPRLVCAASRESFLAQAARAGLAPETCASAFLPSRAGAGSLVVVEAQSEACAVIEVEHLPAATALICGARLDVNTATEAELALLPGIGEVRARWIVESRARDGPFPDAESLDRVHGIGPKTVDLLRPWIAASVAE
jgi:competence ComEA-like helix-hairpin-helix protein